MPGNDFLLYYTELLLLFCFLGVSVHVIGLYYITGKTAKVILLKVIFYLDE